MKNEEKCRIKSYLVIDINKSVQHIREHFNNHVPAIGLHGWKTIDQNKGAELYHFVHGSQSGGEGEI